MCISRDFNDHVGKDSNGCVDVHGGFEYDQKNVDGERVFEFANNFRLKSLIHSFEKMWKTDII